MRRFRPPMCTVTLFRDPHRTLLTMNRDELRTRGPERPPRVFGSPPAPRWAAPLDSDSGGTWIGLNAEGLAACILNRYRPDMAGGATPRKAAERPSRGDIVPALLAHGPAPAARDWLHETFDPRPYDGFTLVLAWPGGAERYWWDGEGQLNREALGKGWAMFTSVAWREPEAQAWRRAQFECWLGQGAAFEGLLPAYHLLEPADRRAWAPVMERPEAATRSICQLEWSNGEGRGELRHWPVPVGAPRQPPHRVDLPGGGLQAPSI